MILEAIEQSAKTIVESSYEYDIALQKRNRKKAAQTKNYIIKVCNNIKKLVEKEKKKCSV